MYCIWDNRKGQLDFALFLIWVTLPELYSWYIFICTPVSLLSRWCVTARILGSVGLLVNELPCRKKIYHFNQCFIGLDFKAWSSFSAGPFALENNKGACLFGISVIYAYPTGLSVEYSWKLASRSWKVQVLISNRYWGKRASLLFWWLPLRRPLPLSLLVRGLEGLAPAW